MGLFDLGLGGLTNFHFDPTPGFNIDAHAGGGIPFISKGNGSTGIAPSQPVPIKQRIPRR